VIRRWLVCGLLLWSAVSFAQGGGSDPVLDGYITRVGSPLNFDVNGFHVVASPTNELGLGLLYLENPYIGEPIEVYGLLRKKKHTVIADRIEIKQTKIEVRGTAAIMNLVPPGHGALSGSVTVSADGYRILIPAEAEKTFRPPLASFVDVGTSVWITYKGKQRKDGIIIADSVVFARNEIGRGEQKYIAKSEYDPAKINPSAKQSALSQAFAGVDPKKVAPYHDDRMQARVDRIAASLVPAYQRALLQGDPAKIDFRVELIDKPHWRDKQSFQSGIILLPKQIVERMQNDSQLAALIANGMAVALERQWWRLRGTTEKFGSAAIAGDVAGAFVPGLGIATGITAYAASDSAVKATDEQRARVSLVLMHDAGYDILEAPIAWWLVSSRAPRTPPLADEVLPNDVGYLYQTLGTTWREELASTATAP
jgi:hypothetical protein